MAFNVQWTIEGNKQLSRNLQILADRVKDWTPAFQKTAEYLKDVFSNEVFNTEGGAINEHWSPLTKAYALRKNTKYPGKGTLEATGNMRSGFMTLWRPDMAMVWNKVEYFKYHQSNLPRNKMPRRVMMKLGNLQKEEVVRIFNTHFSQVMETIK